MANLKLIVVGETGCGKTSLIRALLGRHFVIRYRKTKFHEGHEFTVETDEETVNFEIWEISRQVAFSARRDVDAILGCFSIDNRRYYTEVADLYSSARNYIQARQQLLETRGIPVILVGTKCDLRGNPSAPRDDGQAQASSSENVKEASLAAGGDETSGSSSDNTKASALQSSGAKPSTSTATEKSSLLPAGEPPASGPAPRDDEQAQSSKNVQETSFTTGGAEATTSSSDKTKPFASQSSEAKPSTSTATEKSSLLPAVETSAPVGASRQAPRVVIPTVTTEEGEALAEEMHATGYYECSAMTDEGVDELRQALCTLVVEEDCSCRECSSRCVLDFFGCKCRRNQ